MAVKESSASKIKIQRGRCIIRIVRGAGVCARNSTGRVGYIQESSV